MSTVVVEFNARRPKSANGKTAQSAPQEQRAEALPVSRKSFLVMLIGFAVATVFAIAVHLSAALVETDRGFFHSLNIGELMLIMAGAPLPLVAVRPRRLGAPFR